MRTASEAAETASPPLVTVTVPPDTSTKPRVASSVFVEVMPSPPAVSVVVPPVTVAASLPRSASSVAVTVMVPPVIARSSSLEMPSSTSPATVRAPSPAIVRSASLAIAAAASASLVPPAVSLTLLLEPLARTMPTSSAVVTRMPGPVVFVMSAPSSTRTTVASSSAATTMPPVSVPVSR
ncbi:hypothetical protein HNR16_002029 [Pseudoclavibacter chungangensis]|nr:hypothetical protein [Pseudoclavibacter chungangensis]